MRGDTETIKGKLDIAEVISGYIKLEKAGINYKARCPFHNEKTPSFFVSPTRQNYYCFGCGAKGDIFTFVEEMEGLEFREALKFLADKAGVELEYNRGESRTEKDKIYEVVEAATKFFEMEIEKNEPARKYLGSRGLTAETIKNWRIGYAPDEWRSLYHHLLSLGYDSKLIVKAGLAKAADPGKEPYDVFRNRVVFPLSDQNGRVIAFSGRAMGDVEPKYLNSPDTPLFMKSEVLYGLDKAKNEIRRKNYTVLVEGQMDLVLSHQSGVANTVASSGTAFTPRHLERLNRLSPRIILAFDGDSAGEKAAEKANLLALSLGLEVKIAALPGGKDPAELASKNPEEWKDVLRNSLPSIEFFLNKILEEEKDKRKIGKEIEKKILPAIKLLTSSIEQSHFISTISQRTGIKESVLWDDLKKAKRPDVLTSASPGKEASGDEAVSPEPVSQKERIEERLAEVRLWRKELSASSKESKLLEKEETELKTNLSKITLDDERKELLSRMAKAEKDGDEKLVTELTKRIQKILSDIRNLEENK